MFAGALYRLADLQITQAQRFADYRERRLSHIEQKAPRRGRILAAGGEVIAEDQPTQDLWITPARRERQGRRLQVVSNLPPLTVDQMYTLAATRGVQREFEKKLAVTALTDTNPLVAALAERLGGTREDVARRIVDAVASSRPQSQSDFLYPRLAIEDIDFALGLVIRSARANPFDDTVWDATEINTGGKRVYPGGALFGHLTGTVGAMTAEEYVELRGRWDGDTAIPGKGVIMRQGREFFSVLPGPDGGSTDEETIIRLTQVRRDGQLENTQGYFVNPIVGRGGLEQYYNQALRGRHRLQRLRLTMDEASGRRHFQPRGGTTRAENGQDIRISIRSDVQRRAGEILANHITRIQKEFGRTRWTPSGVVIMMDPNNGRIHALVSQPSYDPNTFNRDFAKLAGDSRLPLLDRAVSGIYPPGSIVKPVVGYAALAENVVMPGQRFTCDRVMLLGGARFTCLGRHGDLDLESALMHSCNMYFYHAGEALGGRRLYEWYARMGMGHKTGIDISGESSGILPRRAFTRQGWATGNTYHMAIGQGIAVTPVQMAVTYAALANARGNTAHIVRPHFLIPPETAPETPEAEALAEEALRLDRPMAEIMVDKELLDIVRQGMWETVQGKPGTDEQGTGRLAAFPDGHGGFLIELGGKTGTAEWSQVVGGRAVKQTSHVWFAGYAPYDRPELVVIVFLPEAGIGGGSLCAPIAKDLLRMWFNIPDPAQDMVEEEDALG